MTMEEIKSEFDYSDFDIAFSLCEALHEYLPLVWSGETSEEYIAYCSLSRQPINFHASILGIILEEDLLSELCHNDMLSNNNWKHYYSMLLEICNNLSD